MTVMHHPDISTLMSYSAGSLGEALSAVVACHLEMCPACVSELANMNRIGGALLERQAGSELSAQVVHSVMRQLDGPARAAAAPAKPSDVPAPLHKLIGTSLADANWKRLAPGVRHIRLPLSSTSGGDLRLLRVAPGHKLPDHGHGGAELTLVITGAYDDRVGHFARGDVADLDDDIEHQPIASAGAECICLIASEHKARFKSVLGRLLQPLFGM